MAVISSVSASPAPSPGMSSVEEKPLIWNVKNSQLKWNGNHLLTFLGILFNDLNDCNAAAVICLMAMRVLLMLNVLFLILQKYWKM